MTVHQLFGIRLLDMKFNIHFQSNTNDQRWCAMCNPLWLRCQCECTMFDLWCTLYVLHKYIYHMVKWSKTFRSISFRFDDDLFSIYIYFSFFLNFSVAIAMCSCISIQSLYCYLAWIEKTNAGYHFQHFSNQKRLNWHWTFRNISIAQLMSHVYE